MVSAGEDESEQVNLHIKLSTAFFAAEMQLIQLYVHVRRTAVRHHIEPRQLGIFFDTFHDFVSAKLSGSSLVSVVPIVHVQEWAPHSPELNPLDSVWDILQERVYEGRREPYAKLHELEETMTKMEL